LEGDGGPGVTEHHGVTNSTSYARMERMRSDQEESRVEASVLKTVDRVESRFGGMPGDDSLAPRMKLMMAVRAREYAERFRDLYESDGATPTTASGCTWTTWDTVQAFAFTPYGIYHGYGCVREYITLDNYTSVLSKISDADEALAHTLETFHDPEEVLANAAAGAVDISLLKPADSAVSWLSSEATNGYYVVNVPTFGGPIYEDRAGDGAGEWLGVGVPLAYSAWRAYPTLSALVKPGTLDDAAVVLGDDVVRGATNGTAGVGTSIVKYEPYPPAATNPGGFWGAPVQDTLSPGTVISRYGGEGGTYASPAGTPFSARALPPAQEALGESLYTVTQPLDVDAGIAAWWQGGGGGIQYSLPASVSELLESGLLKRLGP
jgi:hypothetical protein